MLTTKTSAPIITPSHHLVWSECPTASGLIGMIMEQRINELKAEWMHHHADLMAANTSGDTAAYDRAYGAMMAIFKTIRDILDR